MESRGRPALEVQGYIKSRTKGVGRRFHRLKQQNIRGKGIAIGAEGIELESRGRPALEVQGYMDCGNGN